MRYILKHLHRFTPEGDMEIEGRFDSYHEAAGSRRRSMGGREERAMSRLAINFVQPPARQTKKAKAEWVAWFKTVGPEQFLDVFLHTVENAESMCVQCGQPIYVDVLIGGGAPDWSTEDGDFGCDMSPETTEEGVGSHRPRKRGDR